MGSIELWERLVVKTEEQAMNKQETFCQAETFEKNAMTGRGNGCSKEFACGYVTHACENKFNLFAYCQSYLLAFGITIHKIR